MFFHRQFAAQIRPLIAAASFDVDVEPSRLLERHGKLDPALFGLLLQIGLQ